MLVNTCANGCHILSWFVLPASTSAHRITDFRTDVSSHGSVQKLRQVYLTVSFSVTQFGRCLSKQGILMCLNIFLSELGTFENCTYF